MGCLLAGSWNGLFVILGHGMGGVRGKEKKGGAAGVSAPELWPPARAATPLPLACKLIHFCLEQDIWDQKVRQRKVDIFL